jgi:hypothetical protein
VIFVSLKNREFERTLPQLFVGGLVSYLYYVCLRIVVSNTSWLSDEHGESSNNRHALLTFREHLVFGGVVLLIFLVFCVVFVLFVCVMCLVCSMLPVSLDCPFLIAPSVFSNVMGICWWVPCIMSIRERFYFMKQSFVIQIRDVHYFDIFEIMLSLVGIYLYGLWVLYCFKQNPYKIISSIVQSQKEQYR